MPFVLIERLISGMYAAALAPRGSTSWPAAFETPTKPKQEIAVNAHAQRSTPETEPATSAALPIWPPRTVAVLTTLSQNGPHAIPVSAPIRAADDVLLIALRADRDSLARLTANPAVAITVLAAGDVAFTARGNARRVGEQVAGPAVYMSVAIRVEHVDDHRQSAFKVTSGVEREWHDEAEQRALGQRVVALRELAGRPDAWPA